MMVKMAVVLRFILLCVVMGLTSTTTMQVRVSQGLLEGELVENEYGGSYYSFKGIPFAQPPVGELRFKAPQPPAPWNGVRIATEFGSGCPQYELFFDELSGNRSGSEDCLYLNVYTPEVQPDEPIPVMVWIHGGGFVSGSGDDTSYGPKFLVRQDVVLVTFNYRLEVFGFLSLETEDVPGNAGMKDQVAALRWVKDNIGNFGGDPDNITIFGESAGGVSTSYHLISPMSKGLFKRAIVQSGVTTGFWAQSYYPRERGFALARQLGYYSEDVKEVYEFLKNQPLDSLIEARVPITYSEKVRTNNEIYFSVTAEKDFGHERFFYEENMVDAVSNGVHEGVDIMVGYTADEGLMCIGIFGDWRESLDQARHYPQFFVSYPMSLDLSVRKQLELGKRIKEYYFKNETILTPDDWEKLEKYYSMDVFIFPTIQWIKLLSHSQKNKAYLYKFTLFSKLNMMSEIMGIGDLVGDKPVVAHADDLMYLFNARDMPIIDMNSDEFQYIEKVTKIWTNFAKYGDPTPDDSLGAKWLPFTLENKEYLDIGNELKAGFAPDEEEVQFWEDLLTEYGVQLTSSSSTLYNCLYLTWFSILGMMLVNYR